MAPTYLVVVESPAKCGKIQGFLGSQYQVIASMGHIRQLKEDLEAVGIDRGFDPLYEWSKDKAKAIAQLKDAAKGKQCIYLAADDDREGEFIAYSVCLLLKQDPKSCPRAVFHSITKDAVVNAIQKPRTLDMNRVHAQQSRAILDMLIGFTMSPLLWKHIGGTGLSAGRCQTPALRLVVEKEQQIASFQSSTAWNVSGQWKTQSEEPWPAQCTEDLEDEESASNFLENHVTELKGRIVEALTTPWAQKPPKPLITSSLQQQASAQLRIAPKLTMKIAQKLYEAGHITYMRTDQAVLSEEAQTAARSFVESRYGQEYLGTIQTTATKDTKETKLKKTTEKKAKQSKTDESQSQDAHEAIRPVDMELESLPSNEDWSSQDKRLYTLIWRRTIQSVMAPCRGHSRSITIHSDGAGEDFPWRTTFRKTEFDGWRRVQVEGDEEDQEKEQKEQDAKQWAFAQSLKEGTVVQWTQMEARPHTTSAPQRYSEATLIKELETRGIGRPSTFASLIGTIQEKNYVQTKSFEARSIKVPILSIQPNKWPPTKETKEQKVGAEKDRLQPTPLGQTVLSFLLEHFDDLFMYPFTATMEQRLDSIAQGHEAWKQVIHDTWNAYKERYTDLKSAKMSADARQQKRDFGQGLVAVLTRKGPLLLREDASGDKEKSIFLGWPINGSWTVDTLPEEEARKFAEETEKSKMGTIVGYFEEEPIVKKKGPYGLYVEWKTHKIPFVPTDTLVEIQEKCKAKEQVSSETKRIGAFEIRKGPYGLYMFKHTLTGPKRQFVSVPSQLNLETISESDLAKVFQQGIFEKSQRGGRGGRGPSGPRGGKKTA